MNTTASSARSRSASSNTITGFLPPSSKCTRFRLGAPCAMIAAPVAVSPTKAIALIAGCSVSALPASSPMPCTVLRTPSGTPACFTSRASRSAVTGDHSAGLWTTVQPAASAGAIFQVDSMNGVFHGVITPTGPIGTRVETFQCSSLGMFRPSRASVHLSAKKRKFSAPRIAALAMKRWAWPVSMHSSTAISSARSSMASATRCSSFFRMVAGMSRQALKACAAAVAARSISSRVAARDRRQHRAIDRRLRLKGCARDRRHHLAVDHVPDAVGSSVLQATARRGRDWPETHPTISA